MKYILFLAIFLLIIVIFNSYIKNKEGFTDNVSESKMMPSNFNEGDSYALLRNMYPIKGNTLSNETAEKMWWHYPVFKLGSYKQITNNIKYPNNPDDGTCMPSNTCFALYGNKQLQSNYSKILPPANPECGTRVGYYSTPVNLLSYRTDMQNILY
jgi:hypothetical protein